MAVLDPLKVTITNFPGDHSGEITVPDFPADEARGSHTIPFNKTVYIERSDFREVGLGYVCKILVFFSKIFFLFYI